MRAKELIEILKNLVEQHGNSIVAIENCCRGYHLPREVNRVSIPSVGTSLFVLEYKD